MNEATLDLSVIIVNWNVGDLLLECLRSLQVALADVQSEIVVVDNGSVDGSIQLVKRGFSHVRLIANRRNVGFARANNQGIRQCRGRYVLLLNPDTVALPDTIEQLVTFMDRTPDAGAAGCKQIYADGQWQSTCHRMITLKREAIVAVGLSRVFPQWIDYGDLPQKAREPFEVDWVGGACLIARRDLIERVGLLDEKLFMYAEDADFCHRVRVCGYSVFYLPHVRIIHHRGRSASKSSESTIAADRSMLAQQYAARRYVIRKHCGKLAGSLYYVVVVVEVLRRLLQDSLERALPPTRQSRRLSTHARGEYVSVLKAALRGRI